MTVLGAIALPQLPPERLRGLVEDADAAGLEELWLWEDCFLTGGVAAASAALAWSRRLRVGVGLLPVPLRNVALTAMELATLHRLFPGRAIIGVGHGVQDLMGQVGARVPSPLMAAMPSSPASAMWSGSLSTATIVALSTPSSSSARTALRPLVPYPTTTVCAFNFDLQRLCRSCSRVRWVSTSRVVPTRMMRNRMRSGVITRTFTSRAAWLTGVMSP